MNVWVDTCKRSSCVMYMLGFHMFHLCFNLKIVAWNLMLFYSRYIISRLSKLNNVIALEFWYKSTNFQVVGSMFVILWTNMSLWIISEQTWSTESNHNLLSIAIHNESSGFNRVWAIFFLLHKLCSSWCWTQMFNWVKFFEIEFI